MLKLHTQTTATNVFGHNGSAKCGEIFCQSSTNFTILCTFCELKIFEFEDFLLHFKNMHFENDLLKTEQLNIEPVINIKTEINRDDETQQKEFLNDDSNDDFGDDFYDDDNDPDWLEMEEAPLAVMPAAKQNFKEENAKKWAEDSSDSEKEEDDFDIEYKPQNLKKTKVLRDHKCDHCEKSYKGKRQLRVHMKKAHATEPTEVVVEADTTTAPKVLMAGPVEIIKCTECTEEFPNIRRLESHIIKMHGGLKCAHCQKAFKAKHHLKRHMEIHTHVGEKNFVCDFGDCQKRFHTRRRLTTHMRIHTTPKNLICEICGYTCRVKETLRVHVRTHTGEKPYACNICDKRFASSSLLSEHRATHATDRPHVCEVCGATFSRPKALYHHKHLHLGIKKFKCKVCGNAYAQASGLAGHMRKHKEGIY